MSSRINQGLKPRTESCWLAISSLNICFVLVCRSPLSLRRLSANNVDIEEVPTVVRGIDSLRSRCGLRWLERLEFEMFMLVRPQGRLLVADQSPQRMLEAALAALAFEHVVLFPETAKSALAADRSSISRVKDGSLRLLRQSARNSAAMRRARASQSTRKRRALASRKTKRSRLGD